MSTKIYDAYRVKKPVNLRELLDRMKKVSTDALAGDHDFLYMIHGVSVAKALKAQEKNPGDHRVVGVIDECTKNEFGFDSMSWIEQCLRDAANDRQQNIMNVTFNVSIWFDDDYWYMKFFVNWMGFNRNMMNAIEEACPELEDFHYQNQTDPPENIPYQEYEARDKKWDELTGPNGDYRGMLQFVIFDDHDFGRLVRKYWWTGEQDLYKHLAYKFDKKVLKEKDGKDNETKTTEEVENNNE